MVLFGTCLVGGVLADAWAHTNILETLESFFTPWHGLLYSGFATTAAWTFWLAYRRRDRAPRWWRDAWPNGYRLGALGVVMFLVAGVGDMAWHTVFGVETGLDTAFSPSHLFLDISAVILLTSPMRSWWAAGQGGWRTATGVASMALGVTFAAVLLVRWSAFRTASPTEPYDHVQDGASESAAAHGVTAYLVTTLIVLIPLLLAYRHRPAPGAVTAVVAGLALFQMTMLEFPAPQTTAAFTAIVAAGLADLALLRLDARRGPGAPLRLPIAGALIPALVWTGHLAGLQLAEGIRWPPELWTGTVVVTAVLGALLGGLVAQPAPATPGTAWAEVPIHHETRQERVPSTLAVHATTPRGPQPGPAVSH